MLRDGQEKSKNLKINEYFKNFSVFCSSRKILLKIENDSLHKQLHIRNSFFEILHRSNLEHSLHRKLEHLKYKHAILKSKEIFLNL